MNPERIDELLEAVRGVSVLVVGDLMLDRYISGHVDRVSPEAPVPVVRVESTRSAVGGAGNVAANVTALGARCQLVGCTGDDAAADQLTAALAELGVSTDGVVRALDRPTSEKTRVLARQQQVVRFDVESEADVSEATAASLVARLQAFAAQADVIVVEDYNKGVLVPAVIAAARQCAMSHDLPLVVDPKRRSFFAYEGATLFKPNANELRDALGDFVYADDPDWMESTRARLGCTNLLVTLGERGMALRTAKGESVRIPAAALGVYDVSGAGDTVTAVVALVLAAGGSATEAAILANHAAAVEVGKAGVSTVTPDELRQRLKQHPEV